MSRSILDTCTSEIKKYARENGLRIAYYGNVFMCLLAIMDQVEDETSKDAMLFSKSEDPFDYINDYLRELTPFENEGNLVEEYEGGYLKSLSIMPDTGDVFIEFSTYYMELSELSMNLVFFSRCKSIGFTVQEDDKEKGYMTVGILIESPFA
jgi:hypothetical protein